MSPKNKGKFGKGKPAIETEDEFISTMSRVGKALEPHVKQIVAGVAVVMVLLIAIFGYRWWSASNESHATMLYTQAVVLANTAILPQVTTADSTDDDAGEAPDAAKDDAAKTVETIFTPEDSNDDGLPDSFPSALERAKVVLPLLEQLQSEYGSTETGKSARLLHATMLYDAGRFSDAQAMFNSYLSSSRPRHLELVAHEGMGAASEAQAMAIEDPAGRNAALDATLAIYRNIESTPKALGWDRAQFHSARVLAAQGKRDEAQKLLQQVIDEMPESPMQDDIKERLLLLRAGK